MKNMVYQIVFILPRYTQKTQFLQQTNISSANETVTPNSDVLLTVHLIIILVINQLNAQSFLL